MIFIGVRIFIKSVPLHFVQRKSMFKTELSEKSENIRAESSLRSERTDAASAYGDLHFVDEKRVAIMAYSIVNDETHWKKRKLDKGGKVFPASLCF